MNRSRILKAEQAWAESEYAEEIADVCFEIEHADSRSDRDVFESRLAELIAERDRLAVERADAEYAQVKRWEARESLASALMDRGAP